MYPLYAGIVGSDRKLSILPRTTGPENCNRLAVIDRNKLFINVSLVT